MCYFLIQWVEIAPDSLGGQSLVALSPLLDKAVISWAILHLLSQLGTAFCFAVICIRTERARLWEWVHNIHWQWKLGQFYIVENLGQENSLICSFFFFFFHLQGYLLPFNSFDSFQWTDSNREIRIGPSNAGSSLFSISVSFWRDALVRANFPRSHSYKLTFNPQNYTFHRIERAHLIMPLV